MASLSAATTDRSLPSSINCVLVSFRWTPRFSLTDGGFMGISSNIGSKYLQLWHYYVTNIAGLVRICSKPVLHVHVNIHCNLCIRIE